MKDHRFKPGQSGNPKGRPKIKINIAKHRRQSDLSPEEINKWEKILLALRLSDIHKLAMSDKAPAYVKTLCMALIMDIKNGRADTAIKLRDRQYGKGLDINNIEIICADGSPAPPELMTQYEAEIIITFLR